MDFLTYVRVLSGRRLMKAAFNTLKQNKMHHQYEIVSVGTIIRENSVDPWSEKIQKIVIDLCALNLS